MSRRLWITWENHRRSRELSSEFNSEYCALVYDSVLLLRYPVLFIKTFFLLIKKRPKIVFCQNPSLFLAAILIIIKSIFRFKLIVDRHSNFKFEYQTSKSVKWKCFHVISRWTIRNADLTIVTNDQLKKVCNDLGGRAEVLQDKLPDFSFVKQRKTPIFMKDMDRFQVMFVTTFDLDEPIDEIVESSKNLTNCICYLTGNYKKYFSNRDAENLLSHNIILTGFVSDHDYISLMNSVDLVVVLTKKDLILNCGAYEAISMGKPLILSDTPTLRNYFGSIAEYSGCGAKEIKACVLRAASDIETMRNRLVAGRIGLKELWEGRSIHLKKIIEDIDNGQ